MDIFWNTMYIIILVNRKKSPFDVAWSFSWECSALTLLVGRQKGIRSVKKLGVGLLVVIFWLELCTSYSSSCHHSPPRSSLAPIKFRLETFWYWLTHVHLKKMDVKTEKESACRWANMTCYNMALAPVLPNATSDVCCWLRGSNLAHWERLLCLHHWSPSLHFNGHFPGEPGLAGIYWSKGWWRWRWQLEL